MPLLTCDFTSMFNTTRVPALRKNARVTSGLYSFPSGSSGVAPSAALNLGGALQGKPYPMWPEELEQWMKDSDGDIELRLYGRLAYFPTLRDHINTPPVFDSARDIANEAAARVRIVARKFHSRYQGIFANYADFSRWLQVAGYRQSLRLTLNPERIEYTLDQLLPEHRRLLQWRYIDCLNDEETARLLKLDGKGRGLFDLPEARRRSTEAHRALCGRLRTIFRIETAASKDKDDNVAVFPLFLGGEP